MAPGQKGGPVIRFQHLRLRRGVFGSMFAALVIAVVFGGLATSDRALAATQSVGCGAGSFPTIQAAVNAAAAGDTIQVCNGVYPEQVAITTGNLTLESQNPLGATIKAPPTLPANQTSAIVHVSAAQNVTISGFTISGPAGPAGCGGCIGYGVLVDQNGSATVTGNHIVDIHDSPNIAGNQNGVGIGAGCCLPTPNASSGSVTATGNTIEGYQKAAIDVRTAGSVGKLTNNTMRGAGSTSVIGQNGIQISRGASATVTGNTVSGNAYQPQTATATGIVVIGAVGSVTISNNKVLRNDANIFAFNVKTSNVVISGNATTDGLYGIVVDESTNVVVEKNISLSASTAGLNAGPTAAGNTFRDNVATGVALPGHDCLDESSGSATASTANTWTKNIGDTRSPDGICAEAPVDVNLPPVIVLPPAGTPKPGGPPAQKAADEIITRMKQKQLRSCVIEVRSLGSRRILVARGAARAPATGTGRMVIRIRIKPKGTKLLTKNFGGAIVNVRALCRSTSGVAHVGVKGVRAVLWIEHALTPPGSWVPDQPILTDIGLRFVQRLRSHMRFVRLIKCEGYTATYPPSPAFPPTLSLNRANRVCSELKRTAGSTSARVKLVPHGLTNPIATNNDEAGRRVNRRVFVTVVHFRVIRG